MTRTPRLVAGGVVAAHDLAGAAAADAFVLFAAGELGDVQGRFRVGGAGCGCGGEGQFETSRLVGGEGGRGGEQQRGEGEGQMQAHDGLSGERGLSL